MRLVSSGGGLFTIPVRRLSEAVDTRDGLGGPSYIAGGSYRCGFPCYPPAPFARSLMATTTSTWARMTTSLKLSQKGTRVDRESPLAPRIPCAAQ
jgi:hypothetical protein